MCVCLCVFMSMGFMPEINLCCAMLRYFRTREHTYEHLTVGAFVQQFWFTGSLSS